MNRFEMIKQAAQKARTGIQQTSENKELEKMAKRMTEDERKKASAEIVRMFEEPDYSDEKAADFLYKEHGIEMKPSGVAAIRRKEGMNQRSGRSKKSVRGGAKPLNPRELSEEKDEYYQWLERLEEEHLKKIKALKVLFGIPEDEE